MPFQAPDFRITAMFTDSQQNLWIGSADQGFVTKYSYQERFNSNSYLLSQLKNKSVTSLCTDAGGNLWITTSHDGVFLYDADNRQIRRMNLDAYFPESKYIGNPFRSIFIDRDNDIWLIVETGRLIRCRYTGRELRPVANYYLPTGIFTVTQDAQGTMYAIGFGPRLFMLKQGEAEFQSAASVWPRSNRISCLLIP